MPLLTITDLSISFGNKKLPDKANLTIESRQRFGLIGRNGEGKSTLLNILNSSLIPDEGNIRFKSGANLAIVDQAPSSNQNGSVFDIVASGLGDVGNWISEYRRISEQTACKRRSMD